MTAPVDRTVLIVDDEESLLGILEQFLRERSYRVETATTGEKALSLLEAERFDVVLIDLKLPDRSGLDVIGRFQSTSPATQFVVMTAYASLESTIEALRLNVFDYVLKPFDLVKIGEVVDAACSETMRMRERANFIDDLERANEKLEKSRENLNKKILRASDELAEAHESLKKHVTRLKVLYQMGRDISSNENWSDALDRFLMALCKYLDADGAGLLMFSGSETVLNVRTLYHIETELLERAVDTLIEAYNRDTLRTEIFSLEGCTGEHTPTCLELKKPWEHTVVPLLYKGRWLGFLVIKKGYRSRREYVNDYHFMNTIQTILTEEVANAVNISRLRNLKDFNETILENINSGVLKTDREGNVVFVNRRAREILGGAMAGSATFDELFVNPYGDGGLFGHLVGSDNRSCSLEGTLTHPGGGKVPIRLNSTVVETDDYHGKTIVAVFEDLTERMALEEELRRADRLRSLGELSAGVAHEIRNPLTGIATTAQVLKDKLEGEPEKVKYLSVILEEINRLDEIISNLLTFARPISPAPEELSAHRLIEEALLLLADKAAEKGVTIQFESELAEERCFFDRDQIKQVVLNIALNGIQACQRGGKLSVRIHEGGNHSLIVFEFADTGDGIAEEVSDKLYDPFFTTRPEGTGLGLSISRKIVESHGGTIYHQCRADEGTTFFVELPRRMVVSPLNAKTAKVT